MSGYVAVYRSVFRHPIFKDEPFTEREAWMWLISEAVWKPTRARVGSAVVDLQRGELAHSLRYMQREWKWKSDKRVRSFLKRLESDGMISVRKGTQEITHITICNYEKFQQPGRSEERTEDAARTQRGRKEEEVKKDKKIDDDGGGGLVSQWSVDLADEIGRLCGHDPDFVPPRWHGAPYRVETWRAEGWSRELCLASVREQLAKKRDGPPDSIQYFEKGIARAHAQQSAPLPETKIIPAETIEVRRAAKANTPTDGIRSLRSKILGAGIRSDEDGADVRVLPKGGG